MNTIERTADAQREIVLTRQFDRVQQLVNKLPGVTAGYIGNVERDGSDTRNWYIFLAHPERVGSRHDMIGGFTTNERHKLLPLARALALGVELAECGTEAASINRQDRALNQAASDEAASTEERER